MAPSLGTILFARALPRIAPRRTARARAASIKTNLIAGREVHF